MCNNNKGHAYGMNNNNVECIMQSIICSKAAKQVSSLLPNFIVIFQEEQKPWNGNVYDDFF